LIVINGLIDKLIGLQNNTTVQRILWVLGALSPGVKRLRREVDHSPACNAEVNKYVAFCPYCSIRLHVVTLLSKGLTLID